MIFRTNNLRNHIEPMDAAIDFASRGWFVLPCHAVLMNSGGCTCGNDRCALPGQHPIVEDGLEFSTSNIEMVRAIWSEWPHANVAVRTGTISNLMVLDVDAMHGGLQSLRNLIDENSPLPLTYTVGTPNNGLQYYFKRVSLPQHRAAAMSLGQGLMLWDDSGYVVAPPSQQTTGTSYRAVADGPAVAMPQWLASMVAMHEQRSLVITPDDVINNEHVA